MGFAGGLSMSAIKRDRGVKAGALMPATAASWTGRFICFSGQCSSIVRFFTREHERDPALFFRVAACAVEPDARAPAHLGARATASAHLATVAAGTTLDYVYRNRPSGRGWLGRTFDRAFLESPGWQAVRDRRANLEGLLAEAVREVRAEGRVVSLLDVASGPGAYVLAVLEQVGAEGVVARCRDLDPAGLEEGRAAAARRGLTRVEFEQGDALDRESIMRITPRPNVAVASGFYDWITDDEMVRRSIAIVADALEPGGFFVVTNQVAHPDLAFVSAVFTDHHRRPLRMKMRQAAVVESWLTSAGLAIEATRTDHHGYYSVTRARKP
jgi:SAM-dependent methyltransferase